MDAVQELVELAALGRLKARYFYYLDTKDWDSWLALFTPDARLEWESIASGAEDRMVGYTGVEAIRTHVVQGTLADTVTVHHGHTPLLELRSETEASGIWAMEDRIAAPNRPLVHGFGHYHETYRKVAGEWKFASVHLRRLRPVSTQP